jgi:protein tyrosine phosphatase (PTP) superfamily phosphohydrolase (DUF442 family)
MALAGAALVALIGGALFWLVPGPWAEAGLTLALAAGGCLFWFIPWRQRTVARRVSAVQVGVLYRSGQPDGDALRAIRDRYHIRTVINLREDRPDAPWQKAERDFCQAAGIRYMNIPVAAIGFTSPQLAQFLSIVRDGADKPVLVHCEQGRIRTGYTVAVYRILVQHWTLEAAEAEADKFGLHPEEYELLADSLRAIACDDPMLQGLSVKGVAATLYPLFTGPEQYMRFRESARGLGFLKRWWERRAIARCMKLTEDARTLCDAPCGPGRLFPAWRKWFPSIIGVELSDPMVEAAGRYLKMLGMGGEVRKGDVFHLRDALPEPVDIVASVRFIYYFERPDRLRALRSLAAASRRYVLVQYKTLETFKGRRNAAHMAKRTGPRCVKHYCSDDDIRAEFAEAGLRCLCISPISTGSDFTFVLGEKA